MSQIREFVAGLPKAELHLHLVGSASPETVLKLARRHPDGAVPTSLGELRKFYEFVDFPHFIQTYVKVDDLVREPADLADLLLGLARDAAASNVRYAEVTVTAAMHLAKGVPADELADVLVRAREEALAASGVELAWIFDIPAGFDAAPETVEFAVGTRPEGTVALGLAGLEVGYPRKDYAEFFDAARAAGLHTVAHAGETTGPQEVWDALQILGAERIGHGIGSAQDPKLMAHLAQEQIALELCPTSNVCTRAVAAIEEHPLPALLAAGVPLTLNTDDPGMFHCTLNHEYEVAARLAALDGAGLAALARNSVTFSLAPDATKQRILAEIASAAG